MALKVLGPRVLVKVDEAKATEGGIILPETAQQKPQWGVVIDVGEMRAKNGQVVDSGIAVGDRVMFAKYGGREVSDGGEDYMILEIDQIYALLK